MPRAAAGLATTSNRFSGQQTNSIPSRNAPLTDSVRASQKELPLRIRLGPANHPWSTSLRRREPKSANWTVDYVDRR